jgi:hypothetical protein
MWSQKRGRRGSGSWRQGKVLQAKKKKTQDDIRNPQAEQENEEEILFNNLSLSPSDTFPQSVFLSTPSPLPPLSKYLVCPGVYNEMLIHQR